MLGSWRGSGSGDYPTIEPFQYEEEVGFTHLGKPFLIYSQRTRSADGKQALHSEQGYIRPKVNGEKGGKENGEESGKESGELEFIAAHSTGITEIGVGKVVSRKSGILISLESIELGLSPSAKQVDKVEREIRIEENILSYTLRMAAVGQPLLTHLTAELFRDGSGGSGVGGSDSTESPPPA